MINDRRYGYGVWETDGVWCNSAFGGRFAMTAMTALGKPLVASK